MAGFDGGTMTSDAGALLLAATDRAIRLIERFARCFSDNRAQDQVEHTVATMVGQRVFGIALGYEDLVDHDQLRHDPIMAVLAGKLAARRRNCAPVAGKSTLNRLELGREQPTPYHKIGYDPQAIAAAFVDLFLDAYQHPPAQIVLDLDATDDPAWTSGRALLSRLWSPSSGRHSRTRGTAIVICRFTSFAAGICWRPSCAAQISTPVRARSKRSHASSLRSALAGRWCAFCCAPMPDLPATG